MRRVVPPDRAVVVEDALKGVGAARRVGFALVAWRMPTSYGRISPLADCEWAGNAAPPSTV